MNRWTRLYLQGIWANYSIMILFAFFIVTVTTLIIIFTGGEPTTINGVELTQSEENLLNKERAFQKNSDLKSRYSKPVELSERDLERLVLLHQKIDNGPDAPKEKPADLTPEQEKILLRDEKSDSSTVQRRGPAPEPPAPMTDEELTLLAQAKDQKRALLQWKYDNYEAPNKIMLMIVPYIIIMMVTLSLLRGRTDLGRISQVRDMEKRMHKIRKQGAEKFIEANEAHLVDANNKGIELYSTSKVLKDSRNRPKNVKFVVYRDTSTKETYMSFVPPYTMTADDAMAYKQRITTKQYNKMVLES